MLNEEDFNNLEDYTNYLYKFGLELETLSSTHIRWYTHKNPAGCWICDLFKVIRRWEDLYYPKSPKKDMNKDNENNIIDSNDIEELTSETEHGAA